MKKEIIVKFDEEADKEYRKLIENVKDKKISKKKPSYEQLLASINKTIDGLKTNPFNGNLIPRKYLSKKIIDMYGTNKILRIELVGYWRLLYTLVGDELTIIAFILDFMNHEDYNKILSYRKK